MLLTPYKELKFEFNGKTYYPLTDGVYEDDNGCYRNLVADNSGIRYHAYYTDAHVSSDTWDNPIKLKKL